MSEYVMKVGTHDVKITHPDRVLFTDPTITKEQLIAYYHRIAPIMIPYMRNRPLSMKRFPEGIHAEGFFQKDAPDYFPDWIKRFGIEKEDKTKVVHHVLCNDAATLVYLANQAMITPHLWLSTTKNIHTPDLLIFDLDPPSAQAFDLVKEVAFLLKELIERVGLVPFVKTTGSKGVHVTVPIKTELPFDDVRTFARALATQLAHEQPDTTTVEVRKEKRKGRVFIDYLRNAWAQTAVSPYAVRAKKDAPVATPLQWQELQRIQSAQAYTITNIFRRLAQIDDPWKDMAKQAQSIKKAAQAMKAMHF